MSTTPDYTNVNMACPYCYYDVRQGGCEVCKNNKYHVKTPEPPFEETNIISELMWRFSKWINK